MALMCAERGCLVFRDQDFGNIGFEKQKEIASHFGKTQIYINNLSDVTSADIVMNRTPSQARMDATP